LKREWTIPVRFTGARVITSIAGVSGGVYFALAQRWELPGYPLNQWYQSLVMFSALGVSIGAFCALFVGFRIGPFYSVFYGLALGYVAPEVIDASLAWYYPWIEYLYVSDQVRSLRVVMPFVGVLAGVCTAYARVEYEPSSVWAGLIGALAMALVGPFVMKFAPQQPTQFFYNRNLVILEAGAVIIGLLGGMWAAGRRNAARGFPLDESACKPRALISNDELV
jgi:hypothetical protein